MAEKQIDRSFWHNLEEIEKQGMPNFTLELFELYLSNSAEMEAQLVQAFADKDNKKICYFSHSLKSSSHQMGAVGLSKELESIELTSRQSSVHLDPQLLVSVQARLKEVRAELAQECEIRRAKASQS